jgi:hypothetical protein
LSTATTKSSLPSGVAVVIQIRSPSTIGDDQPLPWIGVFQRTFSASLHFSGSPVAVDTPLPSGPRNWGH